MRIFWFNDEDDVQDRCEPLWDTIRSEFQNCSPSDSLEGVVMIGNVPAAWRVDSTWYKVNPSKYSPEITSDDRYFMGHLQQCDGYLLFKRKCRLELRYNLGPLYHL